jgi:hypothetical protein
MTALRDRATALGMSARAGMCWLEREAVEFLKDCAGCPQEQLAEQNNLWLAGPFYAGSTRGSALQERFQSSH